MREREQARERSGGRGAYHHGALPEALVAAAFEVLDEQGQEKVSVREVARRAGVSAGAPFRHFADRQALLTALADRMLADLVRWQEAQVAAAGPDGGSAMRAVGLGFRFWAVHHWGPVMFAMFRMLYELRRGPERGLRGRILLTASPRTYYVVQYWESKEKLYGYASAPDGFHHTVWGIANRKLRAGKARGHVGLWHETYIVPEGGYESIYFDMPAFGLAGATGRLPVEERGRHAAQRLAYRSSGTGGAGESSGAGKRDGGAVGDGAAGA